MYVRVLQDELTFPDDRAIDQDTKSLIRGVRFLLILSASSDTEPYAAFATKSRIAHVRTSCKTPPVFLYDVSDDIVSFTFHSLIFV